MAKAKKAEAPAAAAPAADAGKHHTDFHSVVAALTLK